MSAGEMRSGITLVSKTTTTFYRGKYPCEGTHLVVFEQDPCIPLCTIRKSTINSKKKFACRLSFPFSTAMASCAAFDKLEKNFHKQHAEYRLLNKAFDQQLISQLEHCGGKVRCGVKRQHIEEEAERMVKIMKDSNAQHAAVRS